MPVSAGEFFLFPGINLTLAHYCEEDLFKKFNIWSSPVLNIYCME
jgi:hypothetical protein